MNVQIVDEGPVSIVRLNRPKVNALNLSLIQEITQVVNNLQVSDQKGVILTGTYPFFSAGLDVKELIQLDESESATFFP